MKPTPLASGIKRAAVLQKPISLTTKLCMLALCKLAGVWPSVEETSSDRRERLQLQAARTFLPEECRPPGEPLNRSPQRTASFARRKHCYLNVSRRRNYTAQSKRTIKATSGEHYLKRNNGNFQTTLCSPAGSNRSKYSRTGGQFEVRTGNAIRLPVRAHRLPRLLLQDCKQDTKISTKVTLDVNSGGLWPSRKPTALYNHHKRNQTHQFETLPRRVWSRIKREQRHYSGENNSC